MLDSKRLGADWRKQFQHSAGLRKMLRPRIKQTTEQIETADGEVYLLRPSLGADVHIGQPTPEDRRLLTALNGERTLEQLHSEFGTEMVDQALAQLGEFSVIEDAADYELLPAPELSRFDRQLRYFSDIGDAELTPSQRQERLRGSKVAMLGAGGLGTWCAWAVACTGVGEMWVIDGDVVEMSNLNRQIFYTEADLGAPKAHIAAARLRSFNPAMKVTATARRLGSEVELADFIAGADFVIDAIDMPALEVEQWCNNACFEADIPYITMSHFPPIARVGPLYVPGETGCFACQTASYRREFPLFDNYMEQRRGVPSPSATLGPACGLIGGQVGMEVVHLLTGLSRPSTLGQAHIYDLRTMEVKREDVVPEPDCPVCAHLQPKKPVREACGG